MPEAEPRVEHSRRASRRAARGHAAVELDPTGSIDRATGFVRVPVIATKLSPPELPAVLVDRPGPRATLDDGADVTLVIAAAGYGKSVAVRHWVASLDGTPVAWFSLDALDRNPLSFWRHLLAALDAAVGIGPEPELVLMDRGPDDPAMVQTLVHRLLELGRPVVLVLEDLHELSDRTALELLAVLVERTGGVLRLVATSRTTPGLPVPRWRLQGRVAEVTELDLRLDARQAAALLEGYGCAPLDDTELEEAVRCSEGWAAGLQLAALARPEHVAAALRERSAPDGLITSYLVDEVLERLPPRQRETAEMLSVLEEFDLRLAAGLTERGDVEDVLRDLHAGHVFLVRSADATYRFHRLFRDVLHDELRARAPQRWTALHHRAAQLLAGQGQVDAAFDHLMTIDDVDAAADLVLRPALDLSDRGWGALFRSWLEQLPAELGVHSAELMLDLAFAHFTAGRLDAAGAWLDRAQAALGADDPRVVSRRLTIAIAAGDVDACRALVGGPHDRDAPPGSFERRIDRLLARTHLLLGDADAAADAIERSVATNPGDLALDVTVRALRSRLLAERGAVDEAEALALDSLRLARAMGFDNNPSVLESHLGWAAGALGRGDIEAATDAAEALLDVIDVVDYPYSRAHAAAVLVDLHALQHGWSSAAGSFDDLCARARWSAGDPLSSLLAPRRVRAALAVGDLDGARAAAAMITEPVEQTLATAAVLLADRDAPAALDLLAPRSSWPTRQQVEAMLLAARGSNERDATALVHDALALAAPLGLAAPFLAHGSRLAGMVASAPYELRRALPALSGPAQPSPRHLPTLVEPLTPRELELLALLPTHLSNAAMGERLFISVNTVKTNLKAIYRKLGTGSRSETVDLARRMGLLGTNA